MYLEQKRIFHMLSIDGREPILVFYGDVDLVPGQYVASSAKLLNLLLEHFLQALVLQFCTFQLLAQV